MRSAIELIQKMWRGILRDMPAGKLSLHDKKIIRSITPHFLDPILAHPLLYRNCDAPRYTSFCSDATKKTMGGHICSLGEEFYYNGSPVPTFWWSLDFTGFKQEQIGLEEYESGIQRTMPEVFHLLMLLRRVPVHINECIAAIINIMLFKDMVLHDTRFGNCRKLWSPYVPLLILCDNQSTVHTFNKSFSLDQFKSRERDKYDLPNFEQLANILFRDVLGIPAGSPIGRDFLNEFMPRKKSDFKSLEVTILPCYVHTTQCTADHLTRGQSLILNDYRIKIDPKKCLNVFGMSEIDFLKAQVPRDILFRTLKRLSKLINSEQERLTDCNCTSWSRGKKW